jgi:hypothetical protein
VLLYGYMNGRMIYLMVVLGVVEMVINHYNC